MLYDVTGCFLPWPAAGCQTVADPSGYGPQWRRHFRTWRRSQGESVRMDADGACPVSSRVDGGSWRIRNAAGKQKRS